MNMIRKGQIQKVQKGKIEGQVKFIAQISKMAA